MGDAIINLRRHASCSRPAEFRVTAEVPRLASVAPTRTSRSLPQGPYEPRGCGPRKEY